MKKRKNKNWKKLNWRIYVIEFLSVFVAVISAFALNNWNEDRRDRNAERNILAEISNGLEKDIIDIQHNMKGHKTGLLACNYWRNIIDGQEINQDSMEIYNKALTRDFISIQNTSGYESLKSKGLEIIEDDSLRFQIISLYEYEFKILRKLEEEYNEMQFNETYFITLTQILSPNYIFDSSGQVTGIKLPLSLSEKDKNLVLTYLRKIEIDRMFILEYYSGVEEKIALINSRIKDEIG